MKKDNSAYPVAKMELKFIKPALFRQKLLVKTEIESVEPSLNINYTITDKKTGEKLLKAKTMQIRVAIDSMESVYEAPAEFLKKIEEFGGQKS